jgi:4-diphosphocytidyl-2-C-methyl-D-erythritol kinase
MLRVVGRRPDGYHLLQTVFQFLDKCDELRFRVREDGMISRRLALAGVSEEQDLALRAARLLQEFSGTSLGAEIELHKGLPMGGGLGGGSSDAATVLVALNHIWGTGLGSGQLAELGLQLGADVPVFVQGFAAWAEGVGERLTPVELPDAWYLVLVPDCPVSTAEIFADPQLTRDSPQITIADFFSGSQGNDCLPVVVRHYPAVAEAIRWLSQFGEPRLTGTGACVFAAFSDRAQAAKLLDRLPTRLRGFVAQGLNRSPLLDRLEAG